MSFEKLFATRITAQKIFAAIGACGFVVVGLPAVAQEVIPGQTIPGETVPGQTVPGETLPGQTVPGETVPGETIPGETVPGQTVPGLPTLETTPDQQPVPDPTFPADPVFPGDFTPEPVAPTAPEEGMIPPQQTQPAPTQVAPPEVQIVPPQTITPESEPTDPASPAQTSPSIQVIPGGAGVLSNPSETPAIGEVIPSEGTDTSPAVGGSEQVPTIQQSSTPFPGSTFAPTECLQGEIYVNLPQWGGGACLAPGQFENIAR